MRHLVTLLFLTPLVAGCKEPPEASAVVELRAGSTPAESANFQAITSLAEYVEVPGAGNELRLTLANYATNCDVFTPLTKGQASVSVVITTPAGVTPTSGVYPWLGHESHGGEVRSPAKPYAFPTVRLGPKSYMFQPGGAVVLNGLSLDKHGSISGLLNFEFSGDAKHPATSLKGRFSARICRFSSWESS